MKDVLVFSPILMHQKVNKCQTSNAKILKISFLYLNGYVPTVVTVNTKIKIGFLRLGCRNVEFHPDKHNICRFYIQKIDLVYLYEI